MPRTHTVAQGDSLDSIAARFGLELAALRELADNAELLRKRPHPQILHPGDVVAIPEVVPGIEVALDTRTSFRRRRRALPRFSLVLQHLDGAPMAEVAFELRHAGGTLTGTTDAAGRLVVDLPLAATSCTITAGAYAWDVDVAHLNPVHETDDGGISGCQGRLRNLGYYHGEIDGAASEALREAVALFQVACGLPRTGELDDATIDRLHERHRC